MPRYIWKGPHTSIELWPTGEDPAEPIYSGPVAPGADIPAKLPEDHDQVRGWLAFGLIALAPATVPRNFRTKQDTGETPAKQENADG